MPTIGNGGYDALHYDVTLNYDPAANLMLPGSATAITMKATQGLSEFSLDLRAYTVSEVTIDGVPATTARVDDKLVITPAAGIANGRTFVTVVKFVGAPLPVIDPDGSTEGWARIASGGFVVNEPYGAMGWLPSNNHPADKATYDYHVTVPATHVSIANGELTGTLGTDGKPLVNAGGETRTWNWKLTQPMATYLTTATVGLFDYRKWALPDRDRQGRRGPGALRRAPEHADRDAEGQRPHRRRSPGRHHQVHGRRDRPPVPVRVARHGALQRRPRVRARVPDEVALLVDVDQPRHARARDRAPVVR